MHSRTKTFEIRQRLGVALPSLVGVAPDNLLEAGIPGHDKPSRDTLAPQRRGVGRWPVTLTTERATPLRRWNPGWGGRSTARRPVVAVHKLFPRSPVFVKRRAHETAQPGPGARRS